MINECRDPFYEMCKASASIKDGVWRLDVVCNLPKHRPHSIHTNGCTEWRYENGEAIRETRND